MADPEVLVVGAGPTGLVLALWLTRLGARVRVIDKTAEAGTTSRAVGVQARTLELYQQADLASAVVEDAVKVVAVNLWVGGGNAARASLTWQAHCYGQAPPAVRAACAARGLELHTFPWQAAAAKAGLQKGAVYLVRPDGYVGLADPTGDAGAIVRYLARHEICAGSRSRLPSTPDQRRPVAVPGRGGDPIEAHQ